MPWVEQQLNIPGDYNHNGVVDAADYVVWRKALIQRMYRMTITPGALTSARPLNSL